MKNYNKLVRDRIPEIIQSNCSTCNTRILNHKEYISELKKKLNEEVVEYQESGSMEEVADILEVLEAIVNATGHTMQEVHDIKNDKAYRRGKFERRIFLVSTD